MGRLKIYKDNYADMTAVSNLFIDEYMKDANDAQLKIYIYLIRMMNANLTTSVSDIADKFNHTEKDVLRALKYWEKNQLLSLEFDDSRSLVGIHLLNLGQKTARESRASAPVVTLVSRTPDSAPASVTHASVPGAEQPVIQDAETPGEEDPYAKPSYSLDQLKEFKSNEESSQLLFIAEQYIGKTLSPNDMKTVLFISDRLGFSSDLIDYLIQYCVDRGKKDFRYIEKVAVNWAQAGITTPKTAERYAYKYAKPVYDVMKLLGKNNLPTEKEAAFVTRWTKELGFEMDVITVACERTVMATEKHRFEYADKILLSWYQAQVHHVSDILLADQSFQKTKAANAPAKAAASNKFNQFSQNNYDFDVLEKELLSN